MSLPPYPQQVSEGKTLRPCLVGLLALAFGPKSQKPNQRGCFWRVLFQKQLFFRSSFLKAGLTLLLAFGFLLFEIGGIKSSSIVVSREIKIKSIFYTCLTKQFSAFLQLTAHSSFSIAHSPQQLSPTATAQPNRASVMLEFGHWELSSAPVELSGTPPSYLVHTFLLLQSGNN